MTWKGHVILWIDFFIHPSSLHISESGHEGACVTQCQREGNAIGSVSKATLQWMRHPRGAILPTMNGRCHPSHCAHLRLAVFSRPLPVWRSFGGGAGRCSGLPNCRLFKMIGNGCSPPPPLLLPEIVLVSRQVQTWRATVNTVCLCWKGRKASSSWRSTRPWSSAAGRCHTVAFDKC